MPGPFVVDRKPSSPSHPDEPKTSIEKCCHSSEQNPTNARKSTGNTMHSTGDRLLDTGHQLVANARGERFQRHMVGGFRALHPAALNASAESCPRAAASRIFEATCVLAPVSLTGIFSQTSSSTALRSAVVSISNMHQPHKILRGRGHRTSGVCSLGGVPKCIPVWALKSQRANPAIPILSLCDT